MAREKKTETRQKILQTAFTMFTERGFESVMMKEIAEACDIGQPLLQYYFRKKEDLLVFIFFDLHLKMTNYIQENLGKYIDVENMENRAVFAGVYYKLLYTVLGHHDGHLLDLYTQILFNTQNLKHATDFVYDVDIRYRQAANNEEKLGAYIINGCLAQFMCIYKESPLIHSYRYWVDKAIEIYYTYLGISEEQSLNIIRKIDEILTDEIIEQFYTEYTNSVKEYIYCGY